MRVEIGILDAAEIARLTGEIQQFPSGTIINTTDLLTNENINLDTEAPVKLEVSRGQRHADWVAAAARRKCLRYGQS